LNKVILHIIFLLGVFQINAQELYDHKLDRGKWKDIKKSLQYKPQKQLGEEWTFESEDDYRKAKEWFDKYQKQDGESGSNDGSGSGDWSDYFGDGSGGDGKSQRESIEIDPKEFKDVDINPPNWNPDFSGLNSLGWVLISIFLGALIVLIIYFIVKGNTGGNKKVKKVNIYEDVAPSEIPLTELQKLLKEALEKQDYRAAVRIYYLFILKGLSQKEWIFWEKEKTNMHYLREMNGKSDFEAFNKSISYFEIIWYGKREINEAQFKSIQPNFTNLLDKLDVK